MRIVLVIIAGICLAWAISPLMVMLRGGASRDHVLQIEREAKNGEMRSLVHRLMRNRALIGYVGGALMVFALLT